MAPGEGAPGGTTTDRDAAGRISRGAGHPEVPTGPSKGEGPSGDDLGDNAFQAEGPSGDDIGDTVGPSTGVRARRSGEIGGISAIFWCLISNSGSPSSESKCFVGLACSSTMEGKDKSRERWWREGRGRKFEKNHNCVDEANHQARMRGSCLLYFTVSPLMTIHPFLWRARPSPSRAAAWGPGLSDHTCPHPPPASGPPGRSLPHVTTEKDACFRRTTPICAEGMSCCRQ